MKLKAILNILRGKPTIYKVKFDSCKIKAKENMGLYIFESNNLQIDAQGHRIQADEYTVKHLKNTNQGILPVEEMK